MIYLERRSKTSGTFNPGVVLARVSRRTTAMFSIAHIVVIFVVALVVFGPEKLPELARNLGKVMGEFRRATGDLRSTFEGHMRDLEREADLRKIRESQPANPTNAPAGAAENSGGGNNLMTALPISTESTTTTADPADDVIDLMPLPGTIQADHPNAAAFAEPASPSPRQLEFETQQLHAGERPDSEPQKANDVRSRPA
jgi:sec-independent protein translocase protein TatB